MVWGLIGLTALGGTVADNSGSSKQGWWGGWGEGFGIYHHQMVQQRKHAKKKAPYSPTGGMGEGFLSGLDLRSDITGPGVYGGGSFVNRGPAVYRDFLLGEMRPGGYLSPGQSSLEAASEIGGILGSGRANRSDMLNSLGASGISSRYGRAITGQMEELTTNEANDALVSAMGATNQRRFDAMTAYVNALSASIAADKMNRKNYEIAKSGAAAAQSGGAMGGIGSAVGGIASAFSDRRVKKNITPVGVEGGFPVYEFEYKGRVAKDMPGRYRGVMADEVEALIPGAVSSDRYGRKRVDYTQIKPQMRRIA